METICEHNRHKLINLILNDLVVNKDYVPIKLCHQIETVCKHFLPLVFVCSLKIPPSIQCVFVLKEKSFRMSGQLWHEA